MCPSWLWHELTVHAAVNLGRSGCEAGATVAPLPSRGRRRFRTLEPAVVLERRLLEAVRGRMKPYPAALVSLLLFACGQRENGESCSGDEDCRSDFCSWGTCRPNLLEWIASWFADDPEPAPPPPPAPAPPGPLLPPQQCAGAREAECRALAHCHWSALCLDVGAAQPDGGAFSCQREYQLTLNCPEGCELFARCF
jgi:hypothetical protein